MSYFGLANLVAGHEAKYPTIVRALLDPLPAMNPRIEWEIENASDRDDTETDWNYCEIIRTPFAAGSSWDAAVHGHLAAIEKTFTDGERDIEATNYRRCGGVETILGRPWQIGDTVKYRPLRDTQLLLNRQAPGQTPINEWITEAGVEVAAVRRPRILVTA